MIWQRWLRGALFVLILSWSVYNLSAVDCNSLQPLLGNCGSEDPCEGRAELDCPSTLADYFKDFDGIDCTSGKNSNYCALTTTYMNCTCEWYCEWDAKNVKCIVSSAHTINGSQVCGKQLKYASQTCTIPP